MSWYRIALVGLALVLGASHAAPAAVPEATSPNDFAFGLTVTPQPGAAVQRLAIPQAVYHSVTTDALTDVALFNHAGALVPMALRPPSSTKRWTPWVALPVFPIHRTAGNERPTIDVRLGTRGAIVSVAGSTRPTGAAVSIVDVSSHDDPLGELALTWRPVRPGEVVRVKVEAGTTLDHWQTIVADASLVHLEQGDHRLEQNRVALNGAPAAYLRITATAAADDLQIVEARVRRRATIAPTPTTKTLAEPTVVVDDAWPSVVFDTGGRFPVARLHLTWPSEAVYALEVEVFSRAAVDDPWHRHGRHRFFRTAPGNEPTVARPDGPALHTHPMAHRYWRFQPTKTPFADPEALALQVAWQPHEAVFVTQGAGPYTLAWGNFARRTDSAPQRWTVADLTSMLPTGATLATLPDADLGPVRTLGGLGRTRPSSSIPWPEALLWSVLVLGVVVVGTVAWRLARASVTSVASDETHHPRETPANDPHRDGHP